MTNRKRTTWKYRLQPLATLIEQANGQIDSMTDSELRKTTAACDRPTPTNCGWSIYHAAVIFKPMLLAEQVRRRYQKQKDAKK